MAYSSPENEADFTDKVKADLALFLKSSPLYSVLVFPPVNSFYRFLIHQLAQDSFDQLRTFSIGEDPDRRIVVCTKDLIARVDASKDEPQRSVKSTEIPSNLTMVVSDAEKINSAQVRKSRSSLPTIGIYRPPAARRVAEDSPKVLVGRAPDSVVVDSSVKNEVTPARSRVRRPDQQVYVPRAKRSFRDTEKVDDASAPPLDERSPHVTNCQSNEATIREKSRSGSNLILDDKKPSKQRSSSPTGACLSLPPRASQLVETKKKLCQSTSSDLDLEGIGSNLPVESDRLSTTMTSVQSGTLPPRVEVLVEKKKKLCQTNSINEDFRWKTKEEEDQDVNFHIAPDSTGESGLQPRVARSKSQVSVGDGDIESSSVIHLKSSDTDKVRNLKEDCDIVQVESCTTSGKSSSTVVSGRTCTASETCKTVLKGDKCSRASKKFASGAESSDDDYQDACNPDKTSSLTDMSDRSDGGSSESLSSSDSVNSHVSPVQLMKPVKTEPKKKSPTKPSRVFNPDECDWDALLDDDGDVLDPFLMKELTSAVGEVQITQPKSDYHNYRSQVPADHHRTRKSAGDDDFSHVVEIFSFPPEFKTSDLVAVLSPFKNTAGGFEIKWVDDTHALGVFASALIAEQVLAYQHPMVRTRPLCDATLESRLKAKRLSESIQSFRPRPETCAALARRLVTGALGVKLPTARQEREEEKRVLREAREKRRLAVQQQDDIWNS